MITKIELEDKVFKRAATLLETLYGPFVQDEEQRDRPDRAIYLSSPPESFEKDGGQIRIGIEITTVDPKEYLAYMNDEKFGKDLRLQQTESALFEGNVSRSPQKLITVPLPADFIYKSIQKKAALYEEYRGSDDFDEIILLCFSDLIEEGNIYLNGGLLEWTNYYLSEADFPFQKVIFVSARAESAIQLYDRSNKKVKTPDEYDWINPYITHVIGQTIPINKSFDTKDLLNSPLIQPKKRPNDKIKLALHIKIMSVITENLMPKLFFRPRDFL